MPEVAGNKTWHLSYAPGSPVHAHVAGMTAILPVPASIQKDHLEIDHKEAVEQYTRPLDQKEFEQAVAMIGDLENAVDQGQAMYALAASFSSAPSNAILKAMAYVGAGMEFHRVSRSFEHNNRDGAGLACNEPIKAPVAYNCLTAVTGVVKGVYGLHDMECPTIPNDLGLVLESRGFTKVDVQKQAKICDNEGGGMDFSDSGPNF